MSGEAPTSQSAIKLAIEEMHEGIQIFDQEFRYLYVNTAAARHGRTNKDALVGKKLTEVYPTINETPILKLMKQVMRDRQPRQMENHFEFEDGSKCWYEVFVEPFSSGILVRSMDITARKKIESNFFHAQKMEAIGRLAGGIAHDFNNKLGIMTLFCEMALQKLTKDAKADVSDQIRKVLVAVQQASSLTKQMLAFSRKQVLDLRITDLNKLLAQAQPTLSKIIGEDISLNLHLGKDLRFIRVDSSQIDQVLLNLVVNSKDAMPKGGKLTIETENIELNDNYCGSHVGVEPGPYVMLSVTDTGTGMTKEIQAQAFEPFFTTKETGKGTGLGLSTVHGIVNQSRGHIWVYSEVGLGTSFKIYFPSVNGAEEAETLPETQPAAIKGKETIFIVEDDPLLKEAFRETLEQAGFRIFVAGDPDEARALFKKESQNIDLLLTDVVLPKMNGRDLALEFHKVRPDLKIIFISGYTKNSIVHHGVLDTHSVLIQKPVSIQTLLATVRQVLDEKISKGVF